MTVEVNAQITLRHKNIETMQEQLNQARNAVVMLSQQLAAEQGALNTLLWVQQHFGETEDGSDAGTNSQ